MRALVFLLKLLLKILVAPVILTLTLFVWICVGIVYVVAARRSRDTSSFSSGKSSCTT